MLRFIVELRMLLNGSPNKLKTNPLQLESGFVFITTLVKENVILQVLEYCLYCRDEH